MATHSSVLAWRIPRTGEPGGLLSVGSHRVRHDWSDLAAAAPVTQSEWSKSKREKQIYINTYMWSLEKWYGWSYFQGRNRDPPLERIDTWKEWGKERRGWTGRVAPTYWHHVWARQLAGTCYPAQGAQLCDDKRARTGVSGREALQGGHTRTHIAETNIRNQYHIVKQLYSS